MKLSRILVLSALCAFLAGCSGPEAITPLPPQPSVDTPEPEQESPADKYGISYLYDEACVPEIHLHIPLDEWNALLTAYDESKDTKTYIHCDVQYIKNKTITSITDAGLRLRGAATRKRPEGTAGEMHNSENPNWNRCHFQLNFRKYVKDDAHTVHGARKVMLRWNHADPDYVREVFCFDLFRRAGVFAGVNAAHCRLFIRVGNDPKECYYGVYSMVEAIDDEFVKVRKEEFGSSKGNLWKCRYKATLALDDKISDIGEDNDEGVEFTYELKTNVGQLGQARDQLMDFITNLNTLEGEAFHNWIASVCDVRLLLRTYAVNVAVGMWDDYWNNMNNYYVYFNSTDPHKYQFYFIPFDYDNSLGNCSTRNGNEDQGRHNPFEWGPPTTRPLIWKIIQFPDYRKIYAEELLRLVDPKNDLMYDTYATARVRDWQAVIRDYIKNDTGEDTKMEDRPTAGSTHKEYRLATMCDDNFFTVKAASIHQYCDPVVAGE